MYLNLADKLSVNFLTSVYTFLSFVFSAKKSEQMFSKLETEIHRFAKRQMTFFRSMESKGFEINWIPDSLVQEQKLQYILDKI